MHTFLYDKPGSELGSEPTIPIQVCALVNNTALPYCQAAQRNFDIVFIIFHLGPVNIPVGIFCCFTVVNLEVLSELMVIACLC